MLSSHPTSDDAPLPTASSARHRSLVGWEGLWSLCLESVRGAPQAANPEPVAECEPGLHWCGRRGWELSGSWDDDVADRFLLYKPLLDRRPGAGEPVRPWVIGQLAQSLDGFVAMASGESCYISGPANLLHLHRLRALCDAVVVGAGTIAADNPQLTTRLVPGPSPVRVVIDPSLGLPPDRRVFQDGQAATLWLHDAAVLPTAGHDGVPADRKTERFERIAIAGLRNGDGSVDMQQALAVLRQRGLHLVFVEGGGATVSRFLAQGLLDRLHLAIAPLLIGKGRPGLRAPARDHLADCLRPSGRAMAMGRDMLWDLDPRADVGASD